jgi:hypothetical protein
MPEYDPERLEIAEAAPSARYRERTFAAASESLCPLPPDKLASPNDPVDRARFQWTTHGRPAPASRRPRLSRDRGHRVPARSIATAAPAKFWNGWRGLLTVPDGRFRSSFSLPVPTNSVAACDGLGPSRANPAEHEGLPFTARSCAPTSMACCGARRTIGAPIPIWQFLPLVGSLPPWMTGGE